MWYIGQKVVYVTGNYLPINSVHTINRIVYQTCGCTCFDIGRNGEIANYITCTSHPGHGVHVKMSPIEFYKSTSFRPIITDSQEYAEKLLAEIETEINEEQLVKK